MNVLLVEDEPAIADTLVYALKTECFEVHHALTGQEALDAFASKPFDFAILDIGLPDMTGLDVCRKLRESSSIPILFLTARNGEVDRILGLELGGDDYVTKPFSPREIVARIRAGRPSGRNSARDRHPRGLDSSRQPFTQGPVAARFRALLSPFPRLRFSLTILP